jgi:hypothetical protein
VKLKHIDANIAGLALATEARRRGITVSVDAEKDRNIASQLAIRIVGVGHHHIRQEQEMRLWVVTT